MKELKRGIRAGSFAVVAAGGSYLAGVHHLLPTPFSFSARLPTPKRSSWPPRRPAATASRGATSTGGATPHCRFPVKLDNKLPKISVHNLIN